MKDILSLISYYSSQGVEESMIPKLPNEKDKLVKRIFRSYPLLGDYALSKSEYEYLYIIAKKMVDTHIRQLQDKSPLTTYIIDRHEIMTLVVVDLAKHWNRDAEQSFSKYVALSFGYNNDSARTKIWSFIKESIIFALDRNKKLFIRQKGDRRFHDTIMAHSFGPNYSWYPVFDLLFYFYKFNLGYYFDINDPLFETLVNALRKRFSDEADDDKELLIASQHYRLRLGVRRLVQHCPKYSVVLFKDIVQRIHSLINGTKEASERYIISLVDSWYLNKIREESIKTDNKKYNGEIVFNYKYLTVRYYQSAGDILLNIPAIRVNNTEDMDAYAIVYVGEKQYKHGLKVFGNELGRTIKHTSISIDLDALNGKNIDIRIVIFYGDEMLYDSENKLLRSVIFFSEGREVFGNNLERGNYTLVCPHSTKLEGENFVLDDANANISSILLRKGFEIRCNGNILAIDSKDVHDVRIVEPDYLQDARFDCLGKSYKIINPDKFLSVYFPSKEELKHYSVFINENKSDLIDFYDENAGNRAVIQFISEDTSKYEITICKDDSHIVFSGCYYVLNLNYRFNQAYYTNANSNSDNKLSMFIDGNEYAIVFGEEQQKVALKHNDGEIVVKIPYLKYTFGDIQAQNSKYIWFNNLTNNSALSFSNSTGKDFRVVIGDNEYQSPDVIPLNKYKTKESLMDSTVKIYLLLESDEYCIGEIVYTPFFTEDPIIKYSDNVLSCLWNPFYIGGKDDINLTIHMQDIDLSLPLQLDNETYSDFNVEHFEEGEYEYDIISKLSSEPIVSSRLFIGSEKYSRFYNRTLCLQYITDSNSDVADSHEIKPVYIEDIKFVVSEYVPSEEGIYDIYSGRMYWINNAGLKVYFSDNYDEEKRIYNVNPVKIIYLNDRYSRIVTQDDDGLYYHFFTVNDVETNQITDRIPSNNNTSFSDVLFFVNEAETAYKEEDLDSDEYTELSADEYQFENTEENDMDIVGASKDGKHRRLRVRNFKPMFSHWEYVEQTRVIDAGVSERIIVNAGPGTGKTWSLIEKIIYLVNNLQVDPETIQVLCFSRAAVEEIKERMKQAIFSGRADIKTNYVDIRTFDSFATQLLYWIKDSDYKILKKNYPIESLNYDERIELLTEKLKLEPNVISQCSHLIVDEVQDLVLSRAELVLQMIHSIPKDSGVTLLGDCCQAIYGYQVEDNGLNTEDFYQQIYDDKDFKRFSYSQNHRQTEWWDGICKMYRSSIMNSLISECNASLQKVKEQIPEYDKFLISDFSEDSLKRIQDKGTVAILTRSNAQALTIANIFKKKNIEFIIRRKRNEGKLNKWIAYLFNSELRKTFDKSSLFEAVNLIVGKMNEDDFNDIWDDLNTKRRNTTGSLGSREILLSICNHAVSKGFYLDEETCNTVISTIHRSKGREYENVIVDSDLVTQSKDELEEHRVTYVALSRAKDSVYSVKLPEVYFRTLENRRCYSWKQYSEKKTLSFIEIGFDRDFDEYSFCESKDCQEYIRQSDKKLIGKKAYLKKRNDFAVNRGYNLFIEGSNKVIATTGPAFIDDLEDAIRQLKNLSPGARVYDSLFPSRLVDIYVSDIATSIGMVRGNEFGVIEYGDRICWNTLIVEGYARADYI